MWLLFCDIFFWACDPSPGTVSSCLPFLAAKSSNPSIFSDAWNSKHTKAYQGRQWQWHDIPFIHYNCNWNKRPVTGQIGQAALRHGLGTERTGFLVLGAAISLSNVSWTLRIHGLRCKRRSQLSLFSFTLSPTLTNGCSQVRSTDLFASSKSHRCHLNNVIWQDFWGELSSLKEKNMENLKSHGILMTFPTFPNLSSKPLEAPCWQLLLPHDLVRNDAATVDEALGKPVESFTNGPVEISQKLWSLYFCWLVVEPTQLKKIVVKLNQFPQVVVNIKKVFETTT